MTGRWLTLTLILLPVEPERLWCGGGRVSKTFSGLRSQWMIRWRRSSARHRVMPYAARRAAASGNPRCPRRLSASYRSTPSGSNTIQGWRRNSKWSTIRTTWPWPSESARDNRLRIRTSSSAWRRNLSSLRTILSATQRRVLWSNARTTWPKLPRPRTLNTS